MSTHDEKQSGEPDSDGWIANLGHCPVAADTPVEVQFYSGRRYAAHKASDLLWVNGGESHHITAYRVIEPASDKPADDGVLIGAAIRLFDEQWVSIVNYDDCYAGYSVEDAVAKAVALTEEKMAANYQDNSWPRSKGGQS